MGNAMWATRFGRREPGEAMMPDGRAVGETPPPAAG